MSRFDGDVNYDLRLQGLDIVIECQVRGHPSDVICGGKMPFRQAREFCQALWSLCDMAEVQEGVELGGEAHRAATVVLPTLDLRLPFQQESPKVRYDLNAKGKA